MKVLGLTEPGDKRSLQQAFRAFGLELSRNDYTRLNTALEQAEQRRAATSFHIAPDTLSLIEGLRWILLCFVDA